MICRNISLACCVFLAVVIANVYSEPDLSTGSDLNDKVNRLATNNPTKELAELLDGGEEAMVTVVAGGTRLAVHRAVLAARGPAIAAMLEESDGRVVLPDLEGPELRQLLAFLYTVEEAQDPSVTSQLWTATDGQGRPVPKAECRQRAATPLSVETAAATAVVAIRHSCTGLRQAAVSFIRAHMPQVIASPGWADAVYNWDKEVTQVTRLLFDHPAETCSPATGDIRTSPTTQPPSHHTEHDQTPSMAAPSVTSSASPPPVSAAISALSTPATGESRTSLTTQAPSHHTDHNQTPSTAAPSVTCSASPPPDSAAISALRSLSAEEKASRLRASAKKGAVGEVAALLAAGAGVGTVDGDRRTALHMAAAYGHVEVAKCLLWAGADVEARDGGRRTALHVAAYGGHVEVSRTMLDAGADVGARDSAQGTPLHYAAYYGRTSIVRLLLAASADPDVREEDGYTPLHWAAQRGHTDIAAALLEAGANRGATTDSGETPLDLARRFHKQEMVVLLS